MFKIKDSFKQRRGRFVISVFLIALTAIRSLHAALPDVSLNLKLAAPINSWDEAVPLGNGLMGGLLWGHDHLVRLSLDRGDLWDERPAVEKEWWKRETWAKGGDWDAPYNGVTPTKLPAGRLEIELDPAQQIQSFELNLATAEGLAHFTNGAALKAFFSATTPVALIRIPGPVPKSLSLIPSGAKKAGGDTGPSSGGAVSKLGYPPATRGSDGGTQWYVQEAADGFKYCACVETKRVGDETLIAVAVTSTTDGAEVLSLAQKRCAAALASGYAKMLKPHVKWWSDFWAQSNVHIPEADIERQYYLVRYFYGAASRSEAPPMPLQGVWTADNGGLPPWKGDYHNDLNTQMTYMAYQEAGNFDEGASFLNLLWNLTPKFRAFAKGFYGMDGLATPGVMSLAGQPLGGWGQYSLSPTMSAWNAHLFYLHWRYTMDDQFLRDRAYPWCSDVGKCMMGLLKPDKNGVLKLPHSSSPEFFDNSDQAWLEPNSNFDLDCLKMLFLSLAEMADALGKSDEAKSWRAHTVALGDFHANAQGELLLDAKTAMPYSHRHLSNLMALYPFNLITSDGSDVDRQRIAASLAQWAKLGTGAWCGYSFSWMSCLQARVGDAEAAVRNLDIFVKAFILRNGFHANGDQTKSGFSGFTYRPFTLEGNFLAMQAVQEMLLQSWSPTPGQNDTEVIRIFPATPWRWHDARFTDLRAEGGYRVSARRERNATVWFRIVASHAGTMRVRDNFGGRAPRWNIPGVSKVGDNFEVNVKPGTVIEANFAVPATIPLAPANLAEPVVISPPSAIQSNRLPLRIGADSEGGNRFNGDLARIVVINRTLTADEIAQLAGRHNAAWATTPGAVVVLDAGSTNASAMRKLKTLGDVLVLPADDGLDGKMFHFTGTGYLEIPHRSELNCAVGITLAAWIRPAASPAGGMRIIDKSPVGGASAYLLDTYPNNSLRLITRDPNLIFDAKLPLHQWTYVAATVDGKTGKQTLFINGRIVAESQ